MMQFFRGKIWIQRLLEGSPEKLTWKFDIERWVLMYITALPPLFRKCVKLRNLSPTNLIAVCFGWENFKIVDTGSTDELLEKYNIKPSSEKENHLMYHYEYQWKLYK